MKKHNIITLLTIFAVASVYLTSCFKDLSTFATKDIPNIVVLNFTDVTLINGQISTFMPILGYGPTRETADTFQLSEYDNYEFVWSMTTSTTSNLSNANSFILGFGTPLETIVDVSPTSGTERYTLFLNMIHKETGMLHIVTWRVIVDLPNALGGGLLVAHTRNEATSDICLIRSYQYCRTMWSSTAPVIPLPDTVLRNVYSERNAGAVNGLISQMMWVKDPRRPLGSAAEIAVIVKDQAYISLDIPTMQIRAQNEQMFMIPPQSIGQAVKPQWTFAAHITANRHAYNIMINDNQMWSYHLEFDIDILGRYSPLAMDPDFTDYELAEGIVVPVRADESNGGLLFDKKNSRIVRFDARSNPGFGARIGVRALQEPEQGSVFDPRNMVGSGAGYDCLFASQFEFPSMHSIWLMRDRNNGNLFIYELRWRQEAGTHVISRGIQRYNVSHLTGINNATAFAVLLNNREFFYAVDNNLYVATLQAGTNQVSGRRIHVFDRNEAVTILTPHLHFDNTGMVFWEYQDNGSAFRRPAGVNGNQVTNGGNLLTAVTHNSRTGEGKVYALPRTHAGAGTIAPSQFIQSWGGFGRITAIEQRHP